VGILACRPGPWVSVATLGESSCARDVPFPRPNLSYPAGAALPCRWLWSSTILAVRAGQRQPKRRRWLRVEAICSGATRAAVRFALSQFAEEEEAPLAVETRLTRRLGSVVPCCGVRCIPLETKDRDPGWSSSARPRRSSHHHSTAEGHTTFVSQLY
jgi:hypothetical protein